MGKETLSETQGSVVTADGGGSNGYRVRLWKTELQKLADELKFRITVCHLPPGTSSEQDRAPAFLFHQHQLARQTPGAAFAQSSNSLPLPHRDGLTVRADSTEKKYPKGLKVSDAQLALSHVPHDFHGEWRLHHSETEAPKK